MKKIIILSYYYSPDLSAGVFRIKSLVDYLLKIGKYDLHIYTTEPNRFIIKESKNNKVQKNLKIFRIKLPFSSKKNLFQIINFIYYFCYVIFKSVDFKYDLVFATSSKLATGFLGAIISKFKNIKLYLDIRDIFSDTIESLYPHFKILLILINKLEKFTINRASHINLVSKGFEGYYRKKYKINKFSFYPNGIDKEFLKISNYKKFNKRKKNIKQILYVGNIGQGQDLHKIIPFFIKRIDNINFTIIGSGNKKFELVNEIKRNKILDCKILDPIPRSNLIAYYKKADVLFLHLANKNAFTRVLPSKIFEYSVFNKPILAGCSGYSVKFLKEELQGSYIFEPENIEMAVKKFKKIKFKNYNRTNFLQKYTRKNINKNIKEKLEKLLN